MTDKPSENTTDAIFYLSLDEWDVAQAVVGIGGFFLAAILGVWTVRNYVTATRSSQDSHMHKLFGDYLRTKFQYYRARLQTLAIIGNKLNVSVQDSLNGLADENASLKLYALEEMWVWFDRRWKKTVFWRSLLFWKVTDSELQLLAWRETILSHIAEEEAEVLESIRTNAPCYSLRFLEFLAEFSKNTEFKKVYKHQREGGRNRERYEWIDVTASE